MYDIICCIIFGFFIIIGISNTIFFLIESLFKFDNLDKENLTADNAEYILRSAKYQKTDYQVCPSNKSNEEIKFICDKLHKKSIV